YLVAAPGDGEDVVALQLRMGGATVVLEAVAARVHDADAAALGGHPDAVAAVDVERLDQVAGQRGGILRIVLPDLEADPVVACQAVPGRDPQVAIVVAGDSPDRGRRQPVTRPEDAEARQFRHRGVQNAGQRQQQAQPEQPHDVLEVDPVANRRNAGGPTQAARRRLVPRMPAMAPAPARLRRSAAALLGGLVLLAATAAAEPARYALDPVHTRVMFAVSHAGFSQALGTVSGSEGTLEFDPQDWSSARLDVRVPLQRLDLGDEDWNRATLARRLLDAGRWPEARFVSERVE